MVVVITSMGRDYISEIQPPTGNTCCPSGDIWAWRTMVELYWQARIPDSSIRVFWQLMNLALFSIFHTLKCSSTCYKILQYGADCSSSPLKEGMLQIFITLKNPSPSAGCEPTNLGPMASTLTTRPPRTTKIILNTKPSQEIKMRYSVIQFQLKGTTIEGIQLNLITVPRTVHHQYRH
jgi:hypothetical protein